MKRTFFTGGMICLIIGLGLQPAVTSVKAETTSAVKQVNNKPPKIPATAKNQPIKIELLNSGTGEKQQLRIQPPANFQQTSNMTMKIDMSMLIGGQDLPTIKQPATVATIETKVTKIEPNGDIHFDFSYSNIDVEGDTNLPPEILKHLRAQMQKLRGIKASAIVDNRGYTKKTNMVLPQGLDPMLKQMMQQMLNSVEQFSSPLPLEPVGVGSQWRVTSTLNLGGMNFSQIVTYQLASLKDGVATLNVGLEQTAPPQKLNTPGLPKGITLNLKSYKGIGQGEIIMGLKQLMPVQSTMSLTSNTEMVQINQGSPEETTISQKISMSMEIESK